ncbi:hypothetical protein G9A89_002924 [Geosiphon pyriformis]|nr:hypothetical protein G9A89_002924 [Geosiphon pyriformis]
MSFPDLTKLPSANKKIESIPPQQTPRNPPDLLDRYGLSPKDRISATTIVGLFYGFLYGSYEGGKRTGFQYLAENAHKLPTTRSGWYFYHKRKNHKVILGGMKHGVRYSVKTGSLCFLFVGIEAGWDSVRGEADFANTLISGLSTALIFSSIYRLPMQSIKYACMFGGGFGLFSGVAQDAYRYYKGERIWYFDRFLSSNKATVKISEPQVENYDARDFRDEKLDFK